MRRLSLVVRDVLWGPVCYAGIPRVPTEHVSVSNVISLRQTILPVELDTMDPNSARSSGAPLIIFALRTCPRDRQQVSRALRVFACEPSVTGKRADLGDD
jgi:hypothetical protein